MPQLLRGALFQISGFGDACPAPARPDILTVYLYMQGYGPAPVMFMKIRLRPELPAPALACLKRGMESGAGKSFFSELKIFVDTTLDLYYYPKIHES